MSPERRPASRPEGPRRVRLCMRDFYAQDIQEMIEREVRRYEMWSIEDPSDPDFSATFQLLWDEFGPYGEMEREDAIRRFLSDDPTDPLPSGTFIRYFLLAAKDAQGGLRGARDGCILYNPAYDRDLCVVYLSHIVMAPEARGTVLSYWLRIAPVELAMQYLKTLHDLGRIELPQPDAPGRYFGMNVDLAAEMEYFTPEEKISWQRILFYGRGGFDAIDPKHFPYRQPDFRDPSEIRATGNRPVPFMVLLRRMGRERQALLPMEEARAVMRLLYDDFACHCAPEFLENSLQLVLDRLELRARTRDTVDLLPLPTGPHDLHRLRKLFRYDVFRKYYPDDLDTRSYLESGIADKLQQDKRFLEHELRRIGEDLASRERWVYPNRGKGYTWDGKPVPVEPDGTISDG